MSTRGTCGENFVTSPKNRLTLNPFFAFSILHMKKTILIVEDELFFLETLKEEFIDSGFEVETATNGAEALVKLESKIPDLMLLDLIMPVMDGYVLLMKMKERNLSCPVVVLSNISDPRSALRCKQFGARAVLVKSNVDSTKISDMIDEFVGAAAA